MSHTLPAFAPLLAQVPDDPGLGFLGDPALAMGMFAVSAVMYVYISACLMVTANKTNTPNAWMAWFPILNIFLAASVARMSAVWGVMGLMPCIQIIAVPMIVSGMATARGKPGWLGILLFIPGVNLLVPAILAMGPGANAPPQPGPVPARPMPMGGGPRICPACGTPANSAAAFCGNCGQPMGPAPVYAAPQQAAGTAPPPAKSSSALGCLMVVLVGGGVVMLGCCGGAAYLYYAPGSYTAPARQAPQVPQGVAGTRTAFPRDSAAAGAGGTRPTTTTSQVVRRQPDGTVKAPVEIPQTQLPPGLSTQTLAQQSNTISSATYRAGGTTGGATGGANPGGGNPGGAPTFGPAIGPPVHIYCAEPAGPGAAQNFVQLVSQANPGVPVTEGGLRTPNGEQYRRWEIAGGQSVTIILQSTTQQIIFIIYAPTPEGVPIASRLADNVGNSQGLNNPEEISCVEMLPAAPPPEFSLEWMWTWSKAETDPAAFTQGTENNPELADAMKQIYQILPELLTIASYRKNEQDYGVVICTYPNIQQARFLWYLISYSVGTQATSKTTISGVSALVFQDQSGAIVAFWKGPYLVFLQTDNSQSLPDLQRLADTLQL